MCTTRSWLKPIRKRFSRFLVLDQSGTVWGLLRLPETDLYLIPDFNTDSVFPPILPFFTDCPRLRIAMKMPFWLPMLWSEVILITVTLFRGLSALGLHKLVCVLNSLARIVAKSTRYSHITQVRKALHWLRIKYYSIFKTAVYKFLHSCNPLNPFLIHRHNAYNTHRSQSDAMFPTLLQLSSLKSILDSVLHMTHL